MFGQALLLKQGKSSTNLQPSATTEINISRSVQTRSWFKQWLEVVSARSNNSLVSATGLVQWTSLVSPCFKESVGLVSVTGKLGWSQQSKIGLVLVVLTSDELLAVKPNHSWCSHFVDTPPRTKDFDPFIFQACWEERWSPHAQTKPLINELRWSSLLWLMSFLFLIFSCLLGCC